MEDGTDIDDGSVSRSSLYGMNEDGDKRNSILGHELILEDFVDDFDTPKRLCLNAKGEQWLHIRDSPDPRVKEFIEKRDVATTSLFKSSQDFNEGDEMKEGDLLSQGKRDTEKANQGKTAFETIMQTQEPSPSQKTLTQIYTQVQTQLQTQYQTQTQDTITQQSVHMSHLEYLNQPTQDVNETATVNVGIGSCIEILSGDELSSLYSGSSTLPSLSSYPPNASAFLCFEEVAPKGLEQDRYMTVKDMRKPHSTTNQANTWEEEIDLWRAGENSSFEWTPLSRRELTILYPGDRLRIRTKASDSLKTAVSIDPHISLLRNTLVTLTYERKPVSSSIKKDNSTAKIVETKNLDAEIERETNIDGAMDVDHERQGMDDDTVAESKCLNSWDKNLNTFVGTAKTEAKTILPAGDMLSRPSISSPMVDSSLSTGIDSTVNTQQESLRSSRMKLLHRNLPHLHGYEIIQDGKNDRKASNDSSLHNEAILVDKKQEVSCEIEIDSAKNTDKNNGIDDFSLKSPILDDNHNRLDTDNANINPKQSDDRVQKEPGQSKEAEIATTQDCNNMEPNDATIEKNSGKCQRDDPSVATEDSAATLLLTQTQKLDSIRSDDSAATILMTQEADFAAVNKHNVKDREKIHSGQSNMCLDRQREKEENSIDEMVSSRHSVHDAETIPRNIEIGNNDQEDRPPISQLLLSMETDNECDDDRDKEKSPLTPGKLQARQTSAKNALDEVVLCASVENKASSQSCPTEKLKNESAEKQTIDRKSVASSLEQKCNETNESVSLSRDGDGFEGDNKQNENDDRVMVESDDETLPGAVVMMHNSLTSTSSNGSGTEIRENQNGSQEVNDRSNPIPNEQQEDHANNQIGGEENTHIETSSQRPHNGQTNQSSSSSTENKDSHASGTEDQPEMDALQKRPKRKFATGDKNPKISLDNEDEKEGPSARSISANKRRRTRSSCSKYKSTSVATRAADELYRKRFNAAIDNNTINIVVSGFEEKELIHISKLCKTKFSNVKRLQTSDNVDEKTTTCILPTVSNNIDEASCRTLKAIQCALLGIPIVSLLWLEQCKEDKKVNIPKRYVRTLSSNVGRLKMCDEARYGVARLAAARRGEPQNPCLLFENASVFLCGKYTSEKKKNITKLLKDGSAKVMTSSREALVKLESVTEDSSDNTMVFLFGDGEIPMPTSLHKKVLAALQTVQSRTIYVVDSNWVSLSIVCGGMLSPANFKPNCNEDLWRLSKDLPEK